MTTPTDEFFDRLSQVGHEPRLANAKGTVRFDLTDGAQTRHWHVAILHGDVVVGHDDAAADAIVTAPLELFDGLVTGQVNEMAAILRGAMSFQGDPQFAVLLRRLFDAPSTAGGRS